MAEKRAAEESASTDPAAPPAKKQRLSANTSKATTDAAAESKSPEKMEADASKANPAATEAPKGEDNEAEDIDIEVNEQSIAFLTGNMGKLGEVKKFFGGKIGSLIYNKNLDLEEVQGTPRDIIKSKLAAARNKIPKASILVEDTSLVLSAYSKELIRKASGKDSSSSSSNSSKNDGNSGNAANDANGGKGTELVGMPGPYVKWLLKWDKDGNEGLCKMVRGLDDKKAFAVCIFGFLPKDTKDTDKAQFFEGRCEGVVPDAPLVGKEGFGWDPVFVPKEDKTNEKSFAQMTTDEKNKVSHRGKALIAMKPYLENFLNIDNAVQTGDQKDTTKSKD